ncbi:MAG: hypothetical protein HYY78_02345 [Betaproteobacteria bacterium]|nr:hypothetical protein [Betaproteobacteria bacterium]
MTLDNLLGIGRLKPHEPSRAGVAKPSEPGFFDGLAAAVRLTYYEVRNTLVS